MIRLLLVPIIHDSTDLGSLAQAVRASHEREFGPAAWSRHEQAVKRLWRTIHERLDGLRLDYSTARIYQDGLPVCGHELEIVKELAGAGSLNHQLVLELVRLGASLMGTEDPQLLIREYQMHRRAVQQGGAEGEPPDEADRLLRERDRFIAKRIVDTLRPGETGLLFLGARHRLDGVNLPNIRVQSLL